MLGQFSSGATVDLITPVEGAATKVLASATVNADGYADITLPVGLASSFIVKVYDATNQATYYDVGRNKSVSFGNKPLYALVPTTVSVSDGTVIGITPVTDMAAALAGVGIGAESIKATGATEQERQSSIYNTMLTAYARSIYLLGWTTTKSVGAQYQLNPLLPAVRLTATGLNSVGVDLGQAGGVWAIYFAEVSAAAIKEGFQDTISWIHSVSSNGDVGLRGVVEGIKADLNANTSKITYSNELVSTIFRSANKAMYDGSLYADNCVDIATSVYEPIKTVFEKSSSTNPAGDFKATTISALSLEIKESISTLLNGNPKRVNLERNLKASCVPN